VLHLEVVTLGYLSEIFLSFQGEGLCAGRRHLFLRLSGCHLRCRYCDTPGSLERTSTFQVYDRDGRNVVGSNPLTPSDVLALAVPLLEAAGGADGVAVTGGEPLLQADFLAELLADARWPRPRLLETSGTLSVKLAAVLPVVDIVSMDIKLPSNTGESPFWDEHGRFLALAGDKAYVKILVDESTVLNEVERAAQLIRREAPGAPVFLQPIASPCGQINLSASSADRFFCAARRHLEDIRVLPQMHKILGFQ
jgi:7-carboxy-7-deazaguanine synthase